MQKRLNELKFRDTGTFVSIDSEDGALISRMAALGIIAERPFEIMKSSPAGTIFRATTTTVMLRNDIAGLVIVEVPDA